LLTSFFRK